MSTIHSYVSTGRKEVGDFVAHLSWDECVWEGEDVLVFFALHRIAQVESDGWRLVFDTDPSPSGATLRTRDIDQAAVLFYGHVDRRGCSELRMNGGFHFDFRADLVRLTTALAETRQYCARILGDQVWSEYV